MLCLVCGVIKFIKLFLIHSLISRRHSSILLTASLTESGSFALKAFLSTVKWFDMQITSFLKLNARIELMILTLS